MLDQLRAYLGGDGLDEAAATQALAMAEAAVRAYTRDRGFTNQGPGPDLQTVVISVAARMMHAADGNQTVALTQGPFARTITRFRPVNGYTLLELAILNRYRVRSL